nr:MAG TPA: Loader and inhibitor of phage G40P [Caudoviricetes sp.]
MTKKEMTEIFAVMQLAYPRAEMFKGGVGTLKPTIELWVACLPDVDFWTGQQAIRRVCRESKFPPTIAEFRAAAEDVHRDIECTIRRYINDIRTADAIEGIEAYYTSLPEGSPIKATIDRMGGTPTLYTTYTHNGRQCSKWNWPEFAAAYKNLIRNGNAIEERKAKALEAPRKDNCNDNKR